MTDVELMVFGMFNCGENFHYICEGEDLNSGTYKCFT